MARLMGTRVEGLNALVRDLQAMGVEVDDLKDAMASIAAKGARVAARFAPLRSGALRRSIRGNRAKGRAVVAAGGGRVVYAGVQNYGWPKRNIPATGFMQRTDAAMRPVALAELEKNVDKLIREKGLQ